MSAREQARGQAQATLGADPPLGAKVIANSCADAASNVWATLLRDVLNRMDEFQDGHECCDADHDGLISRVKELLS
jgi:hypothetical protein